MATADIIVKVKGGRHFCLHLQLFTWSESLAKAFSFRCRKYNALDLLPLLVYLLLYTDATPWIANARIRQRNRPNTHFPGQEEKPLGQCDSLCVCSLMLTATKCFTQPNPALAEQEQDTVGLVAGWSIVNPIRRRCGCDPSGCPLRPGCGQGAR